MKSTLKLTRNSGLSPGTSVASYLIGRLIGQGGMATVYEATRIGIGKRVALKILHSDLARQPEMAERFINEARTASQVVHPGLINIFDCGRTDDGLLFIAMELLEGVCLEKYIQQREHLSSDEVTAIGRQVASALDAVHARGVIHRDLKPANLFLIEDAEFYLGRRVKVLDFGIAKLAASLGRASRIMTKIGVVMGTPHYMAPEQWRDLPNITAKADVYSLGIIMYEMLVGVPPFSGSDYQLMHDHFHRIPPAPIEIAPFIPRKLSDLILRMLKKDSFDRPTMSEVCDELQSRATDERAAARSRSDAMYELHQNKTPNMDKGRLTPERFAMRPAAANEPESILKSPDTNSHKPARHDPTKISETLKQYDFLRSVLAEQRSPGSKSLEAHVTAWLAAGKGTFADYLSKAGVVSSEMARTITAVQKGYVKVDLRALAASQLGVRGALLAGPGAQVPPPEVPPGAPAAQPDSDGGSSAARLPAAQKDADPPLRTADPAAQPVAPRTNRQKPAAAAHASPHASTTESPSSISQIDPVGETVFRPNAQQEPMAALIPSDSEPAPATGVVAVPSDPDPVAAAPAATSSALPAGAVSPAVSVAEPAPAPPSAREPAPPAFPIEAPAPAAEAAPATPSAHTDPPELPSRPDADPLPADRSSPGSKSVSDPGTMPAALAVSTPPAPLPAPAALSVQIALAPPVPAAAAAAPPPAEPLLAPVLGPAAAPVAAALSAPGSESTPVFVADDAQAGAEPAQPEPEQPASARESEPPGSTGVAQTLYLGGRVGAYRVLSNLHHDERYVRFDTYSELLLKPAVMLLFDQNTLPDTPAAAERFAEAAQALTLFEHPAMARVLDAGACTGQPFLVYEAVGELQLDRLVASFGAFPLHRVAQVGLLATEVLAAAAAAGHVHGALRPDCISYRSDGSITVLGLGARALIESHCPASQSRRSALLYAVTAPCAPPEQADRGWVGTEQGDMYSLGAILYYLATGHKPQPRALKQRPSTDSAPTIEQQLAGYGIAAPLSQVIARYLAYKPSDRYPSWAAAKGALEDAIAKCSALTYMSAQNLQPIDLNGDSDEDNLAESAALEAPTAAVIPIAAPLWAHRVARPIWPLADEADVAANHEFITPRAVHLINRTIDLFDSVARRKTNIIQLILLTSIIWLIIFIIRKH